MTEYIIAYDDRPSYTVSVMEFADGQVTHETQYFADPFAAPTWRARWVEQPKRASGNDRVALRRRR